MRKARGFSLIEIAVVLVIAGILLSAATVAVTALTVNARQTATRNKQEAIKAALASYLVRNSRLPCPAVITLASGVAGNGVEAANPGTCTGTTSSGAAPNTVVSGAVPWASLGLPEEASLDGYANRYTYVVTATATNLTTATVSGMLGVISTHSAGPGTMGASPAGNQTNDCSTGTYNPCGAVLAVISHGADGYGAYNSAGVQTPFSASVTGGDSVENTNGDSKLVVKSYSDNEANPFDDIVLTATAGDFLNPLAATGALKDPQTALNTTMTLVKNAVIARAYTDSTMSGSDRQYNFPAALPTLPATQASDPWGTPIAYALSSASVKCSDTPTNVVFMLTSRGPDKAVSADDQTVTVYVSDIAAIMAQAGCNH